MKSDIWLKGKWEILYTGRPKLLITYNGNENEEESIMKEKSILEKD